MATLKSVMAELSSKGSEKTRIIYARHGNHPKQMFRSERGKSQGDRKNHQGATGPGSRAL